MLKMARSLMAIIRPPYNMGQGGWVGHVGPQHPAPVLSPGQQSSAADHRGPRQRLFLGGYLGESHLRLT